MKRKASRSAHKKLVANAGGAVAFFNLTPVDNHVVVGVRSSDNAAGEGAGDLDGVFVRARWLRKARAGGQVRMILKRADDTEKRERGGSERRRSTGGQARRDRRLRGEPRAQRVPRQWNGRCHRLLHSLARRCAPLAVAASPPLCSRWLKMKASELHHSFQAHA